jgi:hypothetical protein
MPERQPIRRLLPEQRQTAVKIADFGIRRHQFSGISDDEVGFAPVFMRFSAL